MKRSTLSFAAVPFEKSIIVADYDRRDITARMSTTKNVPIIRILSNIDSVTYLVHALIEFGLKPLINIFEVSIKNDLSFGSRMHEKVISTNIEFV